MHWRDLLAKLRPSPGGESDLPTLVRESATREGRVSRRAFLGLAGAAVASLAIDPERLIWTPDKTIYLFGESTVDYAFADMQWITQEALRLLKKNLAFSTYVNHEYDTALKVGDTFRVRGTMRFSPRTQPITAKAVPVTLTSQLSVECESGMGDPVSSRHALAPMMKSLADRAKRSGLNVFSPLALPSPALVGEAAVSLDRATGLAVRGIRTEIFNPVTMETQKVLRFDLLGGIHPDGKGYAWDA